MKPIAKLLLGVRADKGVTITVKVDKNSPSMPVLQVHSEGKPVTAVEAEGQAWIVCLPAGDHVLLLAVHHRERFDGKLRLGFDDAVTTFLAGGSSSQVPGGSTPAGFAGDPKDPWPPPTQMYSAAQVPWLAETLWRLAQEVEPTRSHRP